MERARELLKLETIPRELVVALIEKIEIGEKDRETGKQEIRITWEVLNLQAHPPGRDAL